VISTLRRVFGIQSRQPGRRVLLAAAILIAHLAFGSGLEAFADAAELSIQFSAPDLLTVEREACGLPPRRDPYEREQSFTYCLRCDCIGQRYHNRIHGPLALQLLPKAWELSGERDRIGDQGRISLTEGYFDGRHARLRKSADLSDSLRSCPRAIQDW